MTFNGGFRGTAGDSGDFFPTNYDMCWISQSQWRFWQQNGDISWEYHGIYHGIMANHGIIMDNHG